MTPGSPLRALILAAGRGERLRPLTDRTPKPLLPAWGRPMIEWHLDALARGGVREVVINTAWLEDRFASVLGDGERFGLRIRWSNEGRDHGGALETAGAIAKALPWLGDAFWVVAADIVAPEFRFDAATAAEFAAGGDDALLWLVPNPPYHPEGDFDLDAAGRIRRPATAPRAWTYASLALMRARAVRSVTPGTRAALAPLLFASAAAGRLAGRAWQGVWHNVGDLAQWQALQGPPPRAAGLPSTAP